MMLRPAIFIASKTIHASSLPLGRQEERKTDVIFTNLTAAPLSILDDIRWIFTNRTGNPTHSC